MTTKTKYRLEILQQAIFENATTVRDEIIQNESTFRNSKQKLDISLLRKRLENLSNNVKY